MEELKIPRKEIHKAVRNILCNELGLNEESIKAMIENATEQKVKEFVASFSYDNYIREKTSKIWNSQKYTRTDIEEAIRNEIGGRIKKEVKQHVIDNITFSLEVGSPKRCQCPSKINIDKLL
jgi:hypothetical protein